MARDLFRMPKGVPRAVAVAIRAYHKRAPRAGQFISSKQAAALVDFARELQRDAVAEYEVGVDYSAKQYASSNVAFNARIYRRGRDAAHIRDVRRAMDTWLDTGRVPRGFDVMDWFDWQGGITEADARYVLMEIADTGMAPTGFVVEGVDWVRASHVSVETWRSRRRTGRSRDGDETDLFNFRDIIRSVGSYGLRLGAVKS